MQKTDPPVCSPPLSAGTSSSEMHCCAPEGQIAAGTVLGPYSVRRLTNQANVAKPYKFSIKDLTGKEHVFGLADWEAAHMLKHISSASSGHTANCSVLATNGDKQLFVVVTKTVQKALDLSAIFITQPYHNHRRECADRTVLGVNKKFSCPKCAVSFSNPEILQRHQSFYCKVVARATLPCLEPVPSASLPTEQTSEETANSSPASLPYQLMQQQNTIVLPVAFHNHPDEQLVQLIGPAQTIIPVAIHKSVSPLLFNQPLLIDGMQGSQGMRLPIGRCCPHTTTDFHLSLAYRISGQEVVSSPALGGRPTIVDIEQCTNAVGANLLLQDKAYCSTTIPSIVLRKSERTEPTEDMCPLDLSLNKQPRTSKLEASASSTTEKVASKHSSAQPLAQKRSMCDCGVSFISAETLSGHKQFYCRNRPQSECSEMDERVQESVVNKSGPSEKETGQVPHQQQPSRLNRRSILQSFVCIICSYRGYSPRGIKNHLRTSHAKEIQQHINLLDLVHPVNILKTN